MNEPVTVLTDCALGAVSVFWSRRLLRRAAGERQRSVRQWGLAFGALAAASFAGGIYHGFVVPWRGSLWVLVSWSMSAASFWLLRGTALATAREPARRLLLLLGSLKAAGFAVLALFSDDFRLVLLDYGGALLLVAGLAAGAWLRERASSAPWIAAGILVSACAALVQQSGLQLAPGFNHNDLYHLVQVAGLYLLQRGAQRLRDRANVKVPSGSAGRS